MDNKALLVKSISLLYRESLLSNNKENSAELVRSVLENIQVAEVSLSLNTDRDITIALKQTALEMCENPIDYEYDKDTLLASLRMSCGDDNMLYNSFCSLIEPEYNEVSLKKSVINIRNSISKHFRELKVNDVLGKAANQFKFGRDKITNINQFIANVIAQLEPFQADTSTADPAIISGIDIGDESTTQEVFNEIRQMDDGAALMKTGWQGVNRMLQGGFREGDFCVVGALQHNYKTGFTLNLFKQFALYNTPRLRDPAKKPLLLRLSFEDDISGNLQFLYQSLKENETGKKTVISSLSVPEMSTYVKEKMLVNGFHIKVMRVDPTQWNYRSICNLVLDLEAQGYEIKVLMIDYLALLPTTGCIQGAMGADVQDLFRRLRMFTNPRKIICITPHQLSSEANQLVRDGRQNFVKEVASKNYWEKSKGISREVDIEIILNIEKHNKKSFLTAQLGKHRLPTIAPEDHKYVVLPFHEVGGVLDDFNKPESTLKKIGGAPLGDPNGEHIPFWEPTGAPNNINTDQMF